MESQTQTFQSAKTQIFSNIKESFSSLASLFYIPQLKKSFDENVIYILLIIIILIGFLVYIQMSNGSNAVAKALNEDQPTKIIKEVEIEPFSQSDSKEKYGKYGSYGNEKSYDDNSEESANFEKLNQLNASHNNYIENKPKIIEKMSSSFCNKVDEKTQKSGSQMEHEKECNNLGKNSCLSVDCCLWAKYNENGEKKFKCKAGTKDGGITFKGENGDRKKISDIDCYYYKGGEHGIGENCVKNDI